MKVTLHRFGRNRRLVLILEWLTLWPTCGPLAVSSQRRDILRNPLPSRLPSRVKRPVPRVQIHARSGNRGRIGAQTRGVKVLRAPEPAKMPVLKGAGAFILSLKL